MGKRGELFLENLWYYICVKVGKHLSSFLIERP
nr:MAG TPA: hypothetical protein [Caudoviricetes sp.]